MEIDLTTLPPGSFDTDQQINKGIYVQAGESLKYCFAAPGKDRPKAFEVAKGSGHTLVHLERFYTGEADAIATLKEAGANINMDDGWVIGVSFKNDTTPTIENFQLLRKFSKLQSINIRGSRLTDDYYEVLGQLKKLQTLDAGGSNFDDHGLSFLRDSDLHGLWLNETNVTDAGLHYLTNMSKLYNLWLRGTRITDAGMQSLHPMKSLEWVIVNNTQVTTRGVDALRKALPRLERTSK